MSRQSTIQERDGRKVMVQITERIIDADDLKARIERIDAELARLDARYLAPLRNQRDELASQLTQLATRQAQASSKASRKRRNK